MYAYATRGLGFLLCCATISRQLGQGRLRSGGLPLFMINQRSSFRCRGGKRTETRIGMEGICITHSCIPPLWAIMCCMYTVYSGMQEWVIQIPSIPILVSVLFPSLHLRYFRITFLLLVIIVNINFCELPFLHSVSIDRVTSCVF